MGPYERTRPESNRRAPDSLVAAVIGVVLGTPAWIALRVWVFVLLMAPLLGG